MSSFQARDAKIRANGEEETSRSIKRLGSGTSFKARPLPKRTLGATPAAMKVKRAEEEKQRQHFRSKVELFYNSKPELQRKWEKARVTLLVGKYSSGTQWKLFETKLIDKYGKSFQHFQPSAESNSFFESIRQEATATVDGRVPCSYCGRKFVIDRVFKHESICVKTKGKKGANIHIKNHEAREKIRIQRIREKEKTGVRYKPKHVLIDTGKRNEPCGAGSGVKACLLLRQSRKSVPIEQLTVPTDPRFEVDEVIDVVDAIGTFCTRLGAVGTPEIACIQRISSPPPPFTCHDMSLSSTIPPSLSLRETVESFVNQWYVTKCHHILEEYGISNLVGPSQ